MHTRITGHVESIGRGRWRLVVNLPPVALPGGQTRYRRTTKTVEVKGVKAARAALADWIESLEAHATVDPRRLTVGQLCERFLAATASQVRPVTLQFYATNVRLHIAPILGPRLARELSPGDLAQLYADKLAAGYSETTAHHMHSTVSAVYSWALAEELCESNPAKRVKRRPRPQRRAIAVWRQDDVVTALRAAHGSDGRPQLVYLPLVLAAWAGLREGEVCGLRWCDIDLEAGALFVRRVIEQTKGGMLHVTEPKTAASSAMVPLPRQAVEILRDQKAAQDELRLASGGQWNALGYVVCRASGEPVKPSNLASAWSRFCRTHGLPRIRFHDLRHSYATDLFEGGAEKERLLKIVQERLRHAQATTTANIYLHTTEPMRRAALAGQEDRIEAALMKQARDSHCVSTAVVSLAAAREKRRRK